MQFETLTGTKLKKDLGAVRVTKAYHNKQKLGTGNFGFVIVFKTSQPKPYDQVWFRLDGAYSSNKQISNLGFGLYSGGGSRGIHGFSYTELVSYMKRAIKDHMRMVGE